MTTPAEEYAPVRQESNMEAPCDEPDEDFDSVVVQEPGMLYCNKRILVMATAFFCLGFLSGGILVGCFLSQPVTTTPSFREEYSVSYNFLKTARGMSLLSSLEETLEQEGPKSALSQIFELMDHDDQLASSCHPLTHLLGRRSLDQFGFQQAFGGLVGADDAWLLRICNAAFLHGIIEHHLAHSTQLQDDVDMVDNEICAKLTNVEKGVWECHHGVGHGVIQYYRLRYKEQALIGALGSCHNTTFARDCENGLWMDHFASTTVGGELEPSSLQVCSDLATSKWDCSIYSPTEYLLHNPRAYSSAIQFCGEGLTGNLNNVCIQGVGMQAAKENFHDFVPLEEACESAPSQKDEESCFREALQYYKTSTGASKIPKSLCEPLTRFQDMCYRST